jgi:uncharacterized protein YjiS (DUF1127 family)
MLPHCENPAEVQPRLGRTGQSLASRIALGVLDTLHQWQSRSAQRRILAGMSDYHLKDIGLSRADVEGETAKNFWRG